MARENMVYSFQEHSRSTGSSVSLPELLCVWRGEKVSSVWVIPQAQTVLACCYICSYKHRPCLDGWILSVSIVRSVVESRVVFICEEEDNAPMCVCVCVNLCLQDCWRCQASQAWHRCGSPPTRPLTDSLWALQAKMKGMEGNAAVKVSAASSAVSS